MPRNSLVFALVVIWSTGACYAQQEDGRSNRTPISVAVEAEGTQMWWQSSKNFSQSQLLELKRLVYANISKNQTLRIVEANDSENHLHLSIVAASLEHSGARKWFVVSSVVTIAKTDEVDDLLTHDVIAGPDLPSLAESIGVQVASLQLTVVLEKLGIAK